MTFKDRIIKNNRIWIGLVILAVFMAKIDIDFSFLKTANKTLIAYAVILLVGQTVIRAIRWSYITNIFAKKTNFIHSAKIYYLGQLLNEIAPQGTGDMTKAYLTHKSYKIGSKSVLSPVTERIFDITALALGSTLILSAIPLSISQYRTNMIIAAIIIAAMFIIATNPKIIEKILSILIKTLTRGKKTISKGELNWRDLKKKNIAVLAIMTAACWLLEAQAHRYIISSMSYEITYTQAIAIVCFSWLASIPSFLPGGVGVREIIYAYMLSLLGIPIAVGSLIAIAYRAIIWVKFGSLGLISYATYKDIEKDLNEDKQPI